MASYNEQFESQIAVYRRRQRLLVAKSISFKATPADFKNVCRAKLSKPDTVKFFWRAPNTHWAKHRGWAMIAFELRTDCRRAEEELKGFEFHGRAIQIQRASKVARAPTTAAPTTTTPTTHVTTGPVVQSSAIVVPITTASVAITRDLPDAAWAGVGEGEGLPGGDSSSECCTDNSE